MNIILLGAPGAGKGTQAAYLVQKFGFPHISTGDIFRSNIKQRTEIGVLAKSFIDKGQLVPDEVTCKIVELRLAENDCQKGFLLDGFPRNKFQADSLENDNPPDIVLNIDVDLDLVQKRISSRRFCKKCNGTFNALTLDNDKICPNCGDELIIREDDKEESVIERLVVYKKQTEPLIAYYKNLGKFVSVDGNKSIEEVFQEIKKVLDK